MAIGSMVARCPIQHATLMSGAWRCSVFGGGETSPSKSTNQHRAPSVDNGLPDRNLLIVPEADLLHVHRREDVVQRRRLADGGQGRGRLGHETPGHDLVSRIDVCFLPPFLEPLLCRAKKAGSRKPVPLLPLVHGSVCRRKVPEIVAGPRRPRKAMVDVDGTLGQGSPRPDAVQPIRRQEPHRLLSRDPHVTLGSDQAIAAATCSSLMRLPRLSA